MILDRWLTDPISYAILVAEIRQGAEEWENDE